MKFIKSELLQKPTNRKFGKYLLTIEVTDYDIEMFEEFGHYATASVQHIKDNIDCDYPKMNAYLKGVFKVFQRLWRYD